MQPKPTTPEYRDKIRSHIVAAIAHIDASQVVFMDDPETGNEYIKLEFRDDQL